MPTDPAAAPPAVIPDPPPPFPKLAEPAPVLPLEYDHTFPRPAYSSYRWVILFLVFLAITINYIDRMVMGILAPSLSKQYNISKEQYGYITAAFSLSYALGQAVSGRWLDWIGTRVGYAIALLGWSVASMSHALARGALGFGIARGLLGVSESPAYPAATKTLAEWFPKKERALAMGFVNAGSNVGAIAAPMMVPWLALNYGWEWAFIVSGGIGLFWLLAWVPIYRRPHEHPRVSAAELAHINSDAAERTVGSIHLKPLSPREKVISSTIAAIVLYSVVNVAGWRSGWRWPVTEGVGVVVAALAAWVFTKSWVRFITYPQALAFVGGKFLTDPIWSFYLFWLPTFLNDRYGVDLKKVGLPLIVIYLMADVGSIGGGWLSSSMIKSGFSINRARKTALLICAIIVIPSVMTSKLPLLWLAVPVAGLALAAHQGFSSNLYTLVSDAFPKRAVASVAGLGGTAGYVGTALFTMFTGWVVSVTKSPANPNGNYQPVFLVAGSAYLIAFLVIHVLMPRMAPARLEDEAAAS